MPCPRYNASKCQTMSTFYTLYRDGRGQSGILRVPVSHIKGQMNLQYECGGSFAKNAATAYQVRDSQRPWGGALQMHAPNSDSFF